MQRVADDVMSQNFAIAGNWDVGRCGVYHATTARRCPHGVRISVGTWESNRLNAGRVGVRGGAFLYKPGAGECHKFHVGLPLGGGWYVSED
jgi:hypothetical protein